MNYKKMLGGTFLSILVIGALVIRHQEAGYIAVLNGDYKTAENEFIARAEQGGKLEAYYAGALNDKFLGNYAGDLNDQILGKIPRGTKALNLYLKAARLGSTQAAFRYLHLIKNSKHKAISCTDFIASTNKAVQTHHFAAIQQKSVYLGTGFCFSKNLLQRLQYLKWASELSPPYSYNFLDRYQQLSNSDRQKFDATKFQKPPRISDEEFIKYFLKMLERINLI